MDLLNSLREYFTELDETQHFLNLHCRNIQLSLHALHNRSVQEVLHLQEVDDEDETCLLSDLQMDEIDILIKKAERVLVDDVSCNDTKKKTKSTDMKNEHVALTKIPSNKIRNKTLKGSQLSQKTVKRNTAKLRRYDSTEKKHGVAEKRITEPKNVGVSRSKTCDFTEEKDVVEKIIIEQKQDKTKHNEVVSKVKGNDKTKSSNLPLLYDLNFKQEYCNHRKLKRELLKLQHDQFLMKQNQDSTCEFMTSINRENEDRNIDSVLDMNKIKQLSCSGFSAKEVSDIVMNIEDIRKVGCDVIQRYTKCNELDPHLASNNKFYDNASSTKELKDFIKIMQLKYNITVEQKLKSLVEYRSLQGNATENANISQYRKMYSLLLNSNSSPSLVNTQ